MCEGVPTVGLAKSCADDPLPTDLVSEVMEPSPSSRKWRDGDVVAPIRAEVAELAVYAQRLFAKLVIDPATGCWNWTGARTPKGYGHIQFGRRGRFTGSHRLSYILFVADIPAGMVICHRCDNPACCNPQHLWAGSTRDNIHDCMAKGRRRQGNAYGERNPSHKLKDEDVRAIRAAPRGYGTGIALAKQYGVNQATICNLRRGKQRVST